MPLPIAHSAAGVATYLVLETEQVRSLPKGKRLSLLVLAIIAANCADLDFLPGIVLGKPGLFHHGISHSLLFALLIAILLFFSFRSRLTEVSQMRLLAILAAASLSHVLLDFFSIDTSLPYGIPLLWPISSEYYISPVSVFSDVVRRDQSGLAFFGSLLNMHNFIGAVAEVFFAIGLISCVLLLRTSITSKQIRSRFLLLFVSTISFVGTRWYLM